MHLVMKIFEITYLFSIYSMYLQHE